MISASAGVVSSTGASTAATSAVSVSTSSSAEEQDQDQKPAAVSSTSIAPQVIPISSAQTGEDQDPENTAASSAICKTQSAVVIVFASAVTSTVCGSQIAHSVKPPFSEYTL